MGAAKSQGPGSSWLLAAPMSASALEGSPASAPPAFQSCCGLTLSTENFGAVFSRSPEFVHSLGSSELFSSFSFPSLYSKYSLAEGHSFSV